MAHIIDLRSDTVTRPDGAMRKAMAEAVVGDDVYGDDPTVNRLEAMVAEMLGFEAATFAASGTQANLIGILAHCQRGDEYIVGQTAHTYKYEGGGAAILGSIQPQPIEFEADSTLDLARVKEKIKPDDYHFARTRLLCLENTQNGRVLPLAYLKKAAKFTAEHNLQLHLDGARVMNATVAQQIEPIEITKHFNSSTLCLSKGLGAPAGSLLCGSTQFIKEARRWRKVTGGGMRQVGILAAAGIYALENNVDQLAEDHHRAEKLAAGLREYHSADFIIGNSQTNMVFARMKEQDAAEFTQFLAKRGVLVNGGRDFRLVVHKDISDQDITTFLELADTFFTSIKSNA